MNLCLISSLLVLIYEKIYHHFLLSMLGNICMVFHLLLYLMLYSILAALVVVSFVYIYFPFSAACGDIMN